MSDTSVVDQVPPQRIPESPADQREKRVTPAPPDARGHSLQWAVGGFLFFVGGAMLVAPHDYAVVWQLLPLPTSGWWGGLYLLVGLAMMALPTMAPATWFSTAAYLGAAALMLVLAGVYAAAGQWVGVAGHLPLAVGCLVALVMDRRPSYARPWAVGETQADLLRFALGLCGVLSGLVLLAAPAHSADPAFEAIRPLLPWSGVVLVVGGSVLASLELIPLPASLVGTVLKVASVMAGAVCLVYVVVAVRQGAHWPGIAYWGWLGLVMGGQPLLPLRARAAVAPGSLRTRLAFLLAAAAAIPLIVAVAVASDRMERTNRAEGLERQQAQSMVLAEGIVSYVNLHQAALDTLASQSSLAGISHEDQVRETQLYHQAFPDMLYFALYRADGSLAATSDSLSTPQSIAGTPAFESAWATHRPAMAIQQASPVEHRILISFLSPIVDAQGQFVGLAANALESTHLAEFLNRENGGQGQVYLVDDKGHAIVHPDADLMASSADLSVMPPVAAALSTGSPDGSRDYTSSSGEQLAGYGRVPGTGWIVVVEESADEVLAAIRAGQEAVFRILLLSLVATVIIGWWAAGRLATPLTTLAHASEALTAGDTEAPLPTTGIVEADYLAQAFGAMRKALAERSAKLKRSESELRETASELTAANRALQQGQIQQHALTRRLLEIQEDERRSLSMDLHDTAAQSMSALTIGLEVLEREGNCSPAQAAQISTLKQTAETVMEDLHRLAVNLRPSSLDRYGLVAALEQLVESFRRQSGAQVTLLVQGMEGQRLPDNIETCLYRIVQESLTNIARHAQAGNVGIILKRDEGKVLVIVEDDGIGFDVDEALRRGRLGLLGMRERAEMLDGTLTIESSPGSGCTVYASLPLEAVEQKAEE